jgi:Predicted amidohydrolase
LDALPYLKSALEKEVDVVLLPEKWTPKTDENVIKNGESAFLKLLETLSEEYSAVLVSGALYEDFSNKKFLSSYVFQEGKLVGVARKIHPFMNEKYEVEAGEELLLFDYKGVKLGLLICYDLDFPETVRLFALKGCDMLLVPAKVVKQAIEAWLIYVQARVLENRLPLAYANVFQPPFLTEKVRSLI